MSPRYSQGHGLWVMNSFVYDHTVSNRKNQCLKPDLSDFKILFLNHYTRWCVLSVYILESGVPIMGNNDQTSSNSITKKS